MKDWQKISEELVYDGFRKIVKRRFRLPNLKEKDIEVFKEYAVVCMLGLTPDNKVILINQFRPGPEKVVLDIPGGYVDKDESALDAAKREFQEETGYTGDFHLTGKTLTDAYSTRVKYNFVVTNCHQIEEKNNQEHEGEFTTVVLQTLEEFREYLRSYEGIDIETGYLALDYLRLL